MSVIKCGALEIYNYNRNTHVHMNVLYMSCVTVCTGGSLQQLLNDTRGLHPSVVTTYAKQLIRGVVYLHGNGIIHRNLCGELCYHLQEQ